MNKIVASVGLVALGASSVQIASAQALGVPDNSKPWSVAATLRGFYDDNTATLPDNLAVNHRGSWGFELSPSAAFSWSPQPATTISLGYLYSYKYYEDRPATSTEHDDQTHTFNASLSHAFNERFQARVSDSFVIGQEPDLLRSGNAFSTYQRVPGDNIRNYGSISFDAQLSPTFGLGLGYDNAYYDYEATTPVASGGQVFPSVGGLLNRMEHGVHIEGIYSFQPETKGLVGYRFRQTDYTADELIGGTLINPIGPVNPANVTRATAVFSDERNARQHTVYLGGEHNFTPALSGGLRVGGSYVDYYNSPMSGQWSPYANLSLRYTYMPESYVQGGFTYDRNATDQTGLINGGNFTVDQESAVVYASVNHRITPFLFGSVIAQYQNSTLSGGSLDDQVEQYYLVGLNLEYRFTQNFSANIGYNYDKLQSDIGRTFDRNRVYFGITASY